MHAEIRAETVGAVQLGFSSVPPVTLKSAVSIDGCKFSAEQAFWGRVARHELSITDFSQYQRSRGHA